MSGFKLDKFMKDIGKVVGDVAEGTMKVASDTVGFVVETGMNVVDGAVSGIQEVFHPSEAKTGAITVQGALKIIYYLMAVDKEIKDMELEEFISIGEEMDVHFAQYKDRLIAELNQEIQQFEIEDFDDGLHDLTRDTLKETVNHKDATIPIKLLLWDIIAIIYRDEEVRIEEKKLLHYVSKQLSIEKSVVLEMENTAKTMIVLENEKNWLKSTNQQFLIIENGLKELTKRQAALMQGIQALVRE